MDYIRYGVDEDHDLLHKTLCRISKPSDIAEAKYRIGSLTWNHLIEILMRIVQKLGDYFATSLPKT
jgi:hypothetical protein